jgi:hypothetical protein
MKIIAMKVWDSFGNSGLIMDYAMIIAFSGSAAILFCYFWKKGRLDFDEGPKHQMLEEIEDNLHGK